MYLRRVSSFCWIAVLDQDRRCTADQAAEPLAAQCQGGQTHLRDEQGEDGDEAARERQVSILHRHGGQFGEHDDDDQFKGLQLADLPFAHQAHDQDYQTIED